VVIAAPKARGRATKADVGQLALGEFQLAAEPVAKGRPRTKKKVR